LVEPADTDQYDAKPDEGKRAENAGQVRHVDEEYLADSQGYDCSRGEPRRLRSEHETRHQ
jgi:hypothetical protein